MADLKAILTAIGKEERELIKALLKATTAAQRKALDAQYKIYTGKSLTPDRLKELEKVLESNVAEWASKSGSSIIDTLKSRITTALTPLVDSPVKDRIKALQEVFQGTDRASYPHARMIARTETGGAVEATNRMAMEEAGYEYKMWLSRGGARGREAHTAIDGQVRKINEPFDVNGHKAMAPLDPALPVGERVNCGCTSVPATKEQYESQNK